MLINKKYSLILLCMLVSSVLFAQSATADLTKRYLERANTQYENAEYDAAYKTINAVLRLNETTGIPANVTLMATQIYSKVLDNILSTGNYDEFTTITSNIESYPSIVDGTLRKKINEVYAKQEAEIEAKRLAAEKAERQELTQIYQNQLEELSKSQENIMTALDSNLKDLGTKLVESSEKSAKSNHMVLIAVFIVCIILVIVFIIVIIGIRIAAKASARQSAQFEATLKLVAGMQQTNNQLLLGNVTDLNGIGGLRSAGSSRWGVDALPAPEMTQEEKDELKQLAIRCEELGSKIDNISKRKNNSKNIYCLHFSTCCYNLRSFNMRIKCYTGNKIRHKKIECKQRYHYFF